MTNEKISEFSDEESRAINESAFEQTEPHEKVEDKREKFLSPGRKGSYEENNSEDFNETASKYGGVPCEPSSTTRVSLRKMQRQSKQSSEQITLSKAGVL